MTYPGTTNQGSPNPGQPAATRSTSAKTTARAAGPVTASLPAPRAAAPAAAPKRAAPKNTAKERAPKKEKAPSVPLGERLKGWFNALRPRVLPIMIFMAVLMLGLRVGDLWRLVMRDSQMPEFPTSMAQSPQKPGEDKAAAGANGANKGGATAPKAEAARGEQAPAAERTAGQAVPAYNTASLGPSGERTGPTDPEILQHYAERRAELDRRAREIDQRQALLEAAEKRIDQKLQELDKVRSDIQKLLKTGDEQQSAQVESLVKIYETMKPKEAARIFEEMDMPILLSVIQKMKETKTAPILAAMEPVKAKEVTAALMERKTLPQAPQ
ncbi:flagellar motility protein MotE (MotC chaperone) [Azospirillum fermentarium]|uniref:MotE family protein n=1 Tax=Azospirillum fermentarium TaxID=1233114 RepID=UPI002226BF30|nr:hypothetical protein [Azospirillum fermentarium]MCW2247097.1 flagellar motility protein MotE (MotC chaperone) [Azospirillum fermentarium]